MEVLDKGIGIAPTLLPHIFELFVPADHAVTKAQGEPGIGLTLVKYLVEMHRGTVSAYREGLRQSEQRFRQLADAMPQIVWTAPAGRQHRLSKPALDRIHRLAG